MEFFTTGLSGIWTSNSASTLDDRTAQALGLETKSGYTVPPLGTATASDSKVMLYIGIAGLVVAIATYFKGR